MSLDLSFNMLIEKIKEKMLLGIKLDAEEQAIIKYIEKNRSLHNSIDNEFIKKLLEKEYTLLNELRKNIIKYNLFFDIEHKSVDDEVIKILKEEGKEIIQRKPVNLGLVLMEIPKFYGADGKIYGPYKVNDIIIINKEDYTLLREKGFIREVTLDR